MEDMVGYPPQNRHDGFAAVGAQLALMGGEEDLRGLSRHGMHGKIVVFYRHS